MHNIFDFSEVLGTQMTITLPFTLIAGKHNTLWLKRVKQLLKCSGIREVPGYAIKS